jgi:predicted  nucleic acid-binding Zn-ribbon protein
MIPSYRDYQESGLGNTGYVIRSEREQMEDLRGRNIFPLTLEDTVVELKSRINQLESKVKYYSDERRRLNKHWGEERDKVKALEKKIVQNERAFLRKMSTFCNRIEKVMQPYNEELN